MPLFKFKKNKPHQPSSHLSLAKIPPHINKGPPNLAVIVSEGNLLSVDFETDEVVLTVSAGVNNSVGSSSQIIRRSGSGLRRFWGDITPEIVDGGTVGRDGAQGFPSNSPGPKHPVANVHRISTEGQSEVHNLREHDQQEAVFRQPTEPPLTVSSDRVGGGASNPIYSDMSEREC